MKHSASFRALFSFSESEVSAAFDSASPLTSIRGVKILKSPALPDTTHAHVLIVPTKGIKSAIARNLLRRRVKAIVYENKLYEALGRYIILLYDQAAQLPYEKLAAFLCDAFKKEAAAEPKKN